MDNVYKNAQKNYIIKTNKIYVNNALEIAKFVNKIQIIIYNVINVYTLLITLQLITKIKKFNVIRHAIFKMATFYIKMFLIVTRIRDVYNVWIIVNIAYRKTNAVNVSKDIFWLNLVRIILKVTKNYNFVKNVIKIVSNVQIKVTIALSVLINNFYKIINV